jgi:DNA mismatch repair protein MutL
MPIQVLPDVVAAQIAAGEVVERPASVVKELVENALDAGAMSIMVEVEGGGKHLIRVSDDGIGIPSDETELAFLRHSTSKLRTIEDLDRIATLGFRGEALASIAAVSRATLVTRHREATAGVSVQVEGGKTLHSRSVGAPAGTVVTVENLFFNTPARLKFLKSESTERRHITQLVTRYAMAYPHVRFRLVQEGREQFHSTGSGDLADVLVEAFGLDTFSEMLEIVPLPPLRPDLPPTTVGGFTSAPGLARANRSHIILFVNGRSIVDQSLTYAVIQAYRALLPDGRFPVAVLLITLPPEEVDVNVHPTKAEVRFRAPDAVFAAVQRAVRNVVADQPVAGPGGPYVTGDSWAARRPEVPGEQQLHMELELMEPGRYTSSPTRGLTHTESPEGPRRPRTLPILRVVGQVGAMYIVAEGPAGLYLIDQHAAHHRVLYDAMLAERAANVPPKQYPLKSVTVDLPPAAARTLEQVLDALQSFGFSLEEFGSNTFRVRAVPALVPAEEPDEVLFQVVEAVEEPDGSSLEDRLAQCLCKLAAFKVGETLTYDDMQDLVQRLERCENPRFSPDGHPTLIHISGEELARQFGRA